MGMKLRTRRAEERDIPALVELLKELFSIEEDFSFDPAKQERGLRELLRLPEERCVMVAEDAAGKAAAMATMQFVFSTAEGAPSGWIEDMVVRKDLRGQGVGREILSALLAWGASKGATRFQLLADKGNAPALDFYKKTGWSGTQLVCLRARPGGE